MNDKQQWYSRLWERWLYRSIAIAKAAWRRALFWKTEIEEDDRD